MKRPDKKSPLREHSKLLWSILFVVIAVVTVWVIVSQGRTFTLDAFMDYIGGASAGWLLAAVLCMVGFIFFEGEAVLAACRAFGCHPKHRQGLVYAASDIYFSAITPSATGGQPACAYFMIKDGIPGSVTTVALVVNLVMYTASILVLSLLNAIIRPELFLAFDGLSRTLILIGYMVQSLFAILLLLLLFRGKLLHRVCRGVLTFLCKIRLLRHEEEKQKKLEAYMLEYAQYAGMIRERGGAMVKVLFLNLAQRICVISVSFFVFLAAGGTLAGAADIWSIQCYSVIGSNSVPIPGAMGVADYIMLDGFEKLLSQRDLVSFELLSRAISFYVCVVVCAGIALVGYLIQKSREKKS